MPSFFIPARSSRHRRACFALYKELMRRAARVPLPTSLAPAAAPATGPFAPHPIKQLIRNNFRQNRSDTSPRLVLGALNNGYKFLHLLSEAQTPTSATHKEVVEFLEERAAKATAKEKADDGAYDKKQCTVKGRQRLSSLNAKKQRQRTLPSAPHPGSVPLLTRRPIPGATGQTPDGKTTYYFYEYVPTSRPERLPVSDADADADTDTDGSSSSSPTKHRKRKVPSLVTDATGIPFLRLGKPQSPVLSRVIRQKGRKRRERMALVTQLQRDALPFAAEEDRWEEIVERMGSSAASGSGGSGGSGGGKHDNATYARGVSVGISYLLDKLNIETADMLARSRALLQIVDESRAQAEREDREARERVQAQQP